MSSEKRVLVIAHNSFSKYSNNGKTFESMFSSFSKENIAQLFFSENEEPDFEFCDLYYKISDKDVLSKLWRKKGDCGGILAKPNLNTSKINQNITPKLKNKLFNFAKSNASSLVICRDLLWSTCFWKTPSLLTWCKSFKPDIIFFVGGNLGFSHYISLYISKYLNIPLITYFTDDYLIYPKNRNLINYIQKRRMKIFYKKTINHSSLCFAIGQTMADEYTSYFNKKFIPIMNSVKKEEYIPYCKKDEVVFSYFGGLHLNRWKMLVRLARNIEGAKIKVYTMTKLSSEVLNTFESVNIQIMGGVKGADLRNAILDSDILIHVESDDTYNRTLTKLSVSTKIPEYLMSGRFILGFGPNDVASMKLLSDNNIGFVLSSETTNAEIKLELQKIINNFEYRREVGSRGYNYALKHFDNESIANEFKKILTKQLDYAEK